MSLPQCIEGCPQHETRVRHKQRHRIRTVSKTSLRGEAGWVQASPGLIKRSPKLRASSQALSKSRTVQGVQGCLEGLQGLGQKTGKARMRGGGQGCLGGCRGFQGGFRGVQRGFGPKHKKTRQTLRNCVASLLRSNIQDFVQEVPLGQMAQGTAVPAVVNPPRADSKEGVRRGKGEVKPPKCPTRQSGLADLFVIFR